MAELGDDVVDEGGTDRERRQLLGHRLAQAGYLGFQLRFRFSPQTRMFQLGPGVVDDGTAALDASEGFQYRRDVIRFQLAALWQQDQLRGGIALRTDAIRERDERLNRRWDIAERRNQEALRVLDTLANRTLLGRLEQLPLPDVLQIDADKIDVLATDGNASLERFFILTFRANRLILECLRLFVVKNILGARCERLTASSSSSWVSTASPKSCARCLQSRTCACFDGSFQSISAFRRPVGVNSSVFGRPRAVFGMLCSVQTSYPLRRPH